MKIKLIYSSFILWIIIFNSSCNSKNELNNVTALPIALEPAIDIADVTVALPYFSGVDLVETNCGTCHSLRYIETQPDMTKEAWDKIVKKMVKNYGAPISDTTVINQIVDYLASVKGMK
ncbi:MAG: cytochrome c [Bacteroidota bacterium]